MNSRTGSVEMRRAATFLLALALAAAWRVAGASTNVVSAAPYVAAMPGSGPAGALVLSDGVDAAEGNPAMLGMRFRWEVRPLSTNAGVVNSFFDYDSLNADYAVGDLQKQLIDRIKAAGGVSSEVGSAATAGIAVGPVAVSLSPAAFGSARFSPGLAQFFVDGNPPGSRYKLDGTSFESLAAASVNLGAGLPVARNIKAGPVRVNLLAVGGAVHYYKAAFFAKGTLQGELATGEDGTITVADPVGGTVGDVYYAGSLPVSVSLPSLSGASGGLGAAGIQPTPDTAAGSGGTGFGGDVGLAALVNDRIRVGVAVRNLATTITWDTVKHVNLKEVSVVGGATGPVPPNFDQAVVSQPDVQNYRVTVPPELVIGASATVLPATEVFLEGTRGFGDELGVSTRLRLRGGVSWTPFNLLKIGAAAGYQAGVDGFAAGNWDLTAGAGLTLGALNLHVGAGGIGGLAPGRWKGARVGASLGFGW